MPHRLLPLDRASWGLRCAEVRALELAAQAVLPEGTLMARAGLAAAQLLRALQPHTQRVAVMCGPGNNGGDGLTLARWLHLQGLQVNVHLWGTAGAQSDRANALRQAQAAGVPITEGTAPAANAECVVDALLGMGLRSAPRRPVDEGIACLRTHSAPILALDVPSGLDADEGQDWGAAACRWTLTFLTPKPGLMTGPGRQLAGELWLASLGIDAPDLGTARLIGACDLPRWRVWSPRAASAQAGHKGRQGDVWVLGGEPTMAGASHLAARAALHAGAGRVYLVAEAGDPGQPELMQRAALPPSQTVVAGCGGGQSVERALPSLLQDAAQLVLDADALNALSRTPNWPMQLRAREGRTTVLTPHPLEAARLTGCSVEALQASRLSHAQALADRANCTVVLKGSGTVIAHPGRTPWINTTGHAALGSPGTGDVLAGWIGGLLTQAPNAPSDELAALAVAWHGAAADGVPAGRGPLTATALLARMAALHP